MDQSLPALGTHEPGDPASTRLATVTIVSDVLLYREGLGASLARAAALKFSIASRVWTRCQGYRDIGLMRCYWTDR